MDLLTNMLIRSIAKVFPFAVGYFFTEEKIAKGVRVQIRSDHEGISVWGGDLPHIRGWVDILNLTPFTIEIDRIFGTFTCNNDLADFYNLAPLKIKPSEEKQIYIHTHLTSKHEAFIQRILSRDSQADISLEVKALIKTSVRSQLILKSVRTNNRRFVNFQTTTNNQ